MVAAGGIAVAAMHFQPTGAFAAFGLLLPEHRPPL